MTEPPRPPGSGDPNDPTTPFNPYAHNDPTSGSAPPPPPPSSGAPQPPGYGAPPPGYQPPPPGYGTPPASDPGYGYGGYSPQPGYAPSQDDKTWIMVAHFGGALGMLVGLGTCGWIAPLVAMLAKGNQSPAVRAEAVKALNFQLLWSVIGIVGWVVFCLAIVVAPIVMLVGIIFGIIAGVRANNNEPYNYPLSYPLIK